MHAVLRGDEACEIGRPARRADGVDTVGIFEEHAIGGELVDMRRANLFVAVTAQGPARLVVGHNKDHIGAGHGEAPYPRVKVIFVWLSLYKGPIQSSWEVAE